MRLKYMIPMVAALALAGCGNGVKVLSSTEQRNAENGARDSADRIGYKYVSCSSNDSQNVGYTTCTILNQSTQDTKEIRCTYSDTPGCKVAPKQ